MSVRVMTAVWELDLPDSEKLVLLALADSANDEGHCWPSMASLSRKCSKGERTVQGAIKALVERGHLTRREVPGKGCNYSVHPRKECTPAESAPAQGNTQTPAAAADKPSRTTRTKKESAHEIPKDWKPEQFSVGSKSRGIVDSWTPDELDAQIEHFCAHHELHGSRFSNWQTAWKTWVLKGRQFAPRGASKPIKTIPAASDTERIKALESMIAVYERSGRESELGPIRRELSTLKAKTQEIAA